jgi:septal ring factor EnvC (AmiA/AmiB activator)
VINWKRPLGGALLATMLLSGAAFAATPSQTTKTPAQKAERLANKLEKHPELQAWREAATQGKDLRAQMQQQHQQNKDAAAQVKESLKNDPAKAEALKQEMAPVKEQAKSLREQLKAGREGLKALWQQFRAAIKSGDQTAANETAQKLAAQRTAQNGLLQQLLDLMKQRLSILNRYK